MTDQSRNHLPENLANPAKRAFAGAGINDLDDLTRMTEPEVLQLHGMGPKAMRQLREALAAEGKSFAEEKG